MRRHTNTTPYSVSIHRGLVLLVLLAAAAALAAAGPQAPSRPPAPAAPPSVTPELDRLLRSIKQADTGMLAVSEEDGRFLRLMAATTRAKRALEIANSRRQRLSPGDTATAKRLERRRHLAALRLERGDLLAQPIEVDR